MAGPTGDDLTLATTDGVRLDAHHDPGPDDLAVVLGHGFTGSWRRPAVRRAAAAFAPVAGVVSLDFRGHGRSGGLATMGDREVLDVAAAVDWARGHGYRRIATVGFSMGSSIVVRHAALVGGVAAVVAVSGPSRWYYRGTTPMRRVHWAIERPLGRAVSRFALRTRIYPAGWVTVPEPPDQVAARIAPTPLLVVHGEADPYFPVEHGEALYAAAAEPKEFWREPGFGHAENAAGPDLLARIATWVARAVGPAPDGPPAPGPATRGRGTDGPPPRSAAPDRV